MFYFGVDYYPEQWPEESWAESARLMAEAGFNVVRLAEFAWSRLEPRQGRFDFDWLDRAIALLASHGMQVILGTPTASPPAWLMHAHPEIFRVREDGQRLAYGNRREYCPSNPLYHEFTRRIVTEMAERYGEHPAILGWQIDNEFGDRCYCPVCAAAFRAWLARRYGSLEALNERWGTTFWSQAYTDWEQIPLPLAAGGSPNPGLALDFYRFSSQAYRAFQGLQVEILREKAPRRFITHNFMGFRYEQLDYFELAGDLDLVSWDNYPRTQWSMQAEVEPSRLALSHDAMRGLKGKNFWVMEQQAGPGGWEVVSVQPRPGELRLWAYQAIAHGADGLLFFRWRTARHGTEQYWHGLLDHGGRPTRRFEEIRRMGAEIRKAGGYIAGSRLRPAIAMLLSYEARFAFQIQPNHPQFDYAEHFHQLYRPFYRRQLPVDVLAPAADLSAYRLALAPALHLVTPAIAENLERFVQAGGVMVFTPRSGVKGEDNAVIDQPLPGLLASLCGVRVEEYDSLSPEACQPLEFTLPSLASGELPSAWLWCDLLSPEGAEVIARYTRDYYAGVPAITLHRYGRGAAVYVGTFGDEALWERLAGWLLELAGLRPKFQAPAGVEVAERWQGERRLLFLLNHTDRTQELALEGHFTDLLDGYSPPQGRLILPPREVCVLAQEPD